MIHKRKYGFNHQAVILSLILLINFFCIYRVFAADEMLTVQINQVSGEPGQEVAVSFAVENNPGFSAFTIDINYDNKIIEPIKTEKSDWLNGFLDYNLNFQDTDSIVRVAFAGTADQKSDGILFTVIFRIQESNTQSINYKPDVRLKEFVNNEMRILETQLKNSGISIMIKISENIMQEEPSKNPTNPPNPTNPTNPPSSSGNQTITDNPPPVFPISSNNAESEKPANENSNQPAFSDVPASSPYFEAVEYLYAKGIVIGTGGNMYSPLTELNRAQVLIVILRAYNINIETDLDDNFADSKGEYYSDYIATAKKTGLVLGVGDNLFAPNKVITREEMYTILYRAMVFLKTLPDYKENEYNHTRIADINNVSLWAEDSINFFVGADIALQNENNLLPQKVVTRAEMALVIYKLLLLNQ